MSIGRPMKIRSIGEAVMARSDDWMRIPGVEGIAIGEHKGAICIKIYTAMNPEHLRGQIPSDAEGYPVVMETNE